MITKRIVILTVFLVSLPVLCIDIGVDTSTGSYEKGMFAGWPKKIYFDYYSSPYLDTSVVFISSYMAKEFIGDATSYYIDLEVIPGNTIYFYFGTEFGTTEEQIDQYRTVYISTSWYNESVTLWSNFYGEPPKVNISTAIIVGPPLKVILSWPTPKFGDLPLLDMFGGGFEVWRSTDNENFVKLDEVLPAWNENKYNDSDIQVNVTYYYKIRSYDAYTIPLYSKFSDTFSVVILPELVQKSVKLVFNLDLRKLKNFSKVYITGEFLNNIFYSLTEVGYKTYRFEYYDELITVVGKKILYQYFIDDKIPDPVGIRTTIVEDYDGDGIMEIFDSWGVPQVVENYLPDSIVYISIEKEKSDDENNKVVIQFDPEEVVKISSVVAYDSLGNIIFTFTPKNWQEIIYTTHTNCYLEVIYTDGKKQRTSLVKFGESIPRKDFISGYVGNIDGYYPDVLNKGGILAYFKVPHKTENLQPTSFVIRYTTSVLTSCVTSYYFDLPVLKKIKSYHSGSEQLTSLKIENINGFPSLFLIVGCVYGNNEKVGLFKPYLVVFPEIVSVNENYYGRKGNYTVGFTTGECKAAVMIEKYSVKEKIGSYAVLIRNYFELLHDEVLNKKISEAHTKLQNDYRIKLLDVNRTDLNNYNKDNTIFAFDILLANNENYFVDTDNDGISDRVLAKDAVIEIPYPSGVNEDKLILCKLNPMGNFWQPIDKQKIEVDKNKKVVKFKTRTFCVYMVSTEGDWPKDLSKVEVYPNPFVGSDGDFSNGEFGVGDPEYECLNFVGLTKNSKIYIFNLAMELVFKEENIETNSPCIGKYRWNFKDFNNKPVPSGMYFYLIKDDTLSVNNYAKGRFTVVR